MFEKLGKSLDVEMKTSAQNSLGLFKAKNCSIFGKWLSWNFIMNNHLFDRFNFSMRWGQTQEIN